MKPPQTDVEALAQALDLFTRTTASMEEAYRHLQQRVTNLDQELATKNLQLALTTDYLSNLLESITDGVIAVDMAEHITRYNRAARVVLGFEADEVVGRPFREVFGRSFHAPSMPGAMELISRSGRRVPVSEKDSVIADRDGHRLGYVKTFQDLSELSALREQVRQIDRLAAIGEMAATVAHEIRNPLGGIRGFASFLAQDTPEDDPRHRLVQKILAGVGSLEKVVSGLLEYTRPVELKLAPASCAAIAHAAMRYMEYDPARITIFTEVDPDLRVLADADRIRQVLMNILLNAVQSIEGRGEIRISADADETAVYLSVQDNGCGMDEAALQQVFSPFFTTKEKGTGLGMAVSQKIVDGHGGAITADSAPGTGTRIVIQLPRAE
ncbi:MAG: PAS domain S-box protein [Candidatus Hydrogenedentes bacterium]|nr:PAS domain S-box protein [Candidatus Hydrogenedentota bacterium]